MQLEELVKKYKKNFKQISTTVKAWPTTGVKPYIYRRYYYIKQKIKQLFDNYGKRRIRK